MHPMSDEVRGAAQEINVLLEDIIAADTPHRAWAAVMLCDSSDSRHHRMSQSILTELRAGVPRTTTDSIDLEHADLACLAMISAKALSTDERARIVSKLPKPNSDRALRSRFYDSPLYVYLVVRGFAADLQNARDIGEFVIGDAKRAIGLTGTDIPDIVLQLATLIELLPVLPMPDDLTQSARARLLAADLNGEAAIAVRWLIELYGRRWPPGHDAASLRSTARLLAERFEPIVITPGALRPEVALMRLEVATHQQQRYRLVSEASLREEISSGIRRHRVASVFAYAVVFALPLIAVARYFHVPRLPAIASLACAWMPLTLWAGLATFGRRRKDASLAGAVILSLIYYGFAVFATISGNPTLIEAASRDVLIQVVPSALMTLFGAWPGRDEMVTNQEAGVAFPSRRR